jgi:C4-dicarboxylate-specific signal transduction histidine kinase
MTLAGSTTHLRTSRLAHVFSRGGLQALGVAGLVAAALLAVLAAALVLDCAERLRSARAWVEHTNTVLTTIADVRASLLTGGVARRSYVITEEAYYLDEYSRQRAAAVAGFDRLSALAADNPVEEKRIAILRRATARTWSDFDTRLRTSGPAAIAAGMRGARGLSLYRQISSPVTAGFDAIRTAETKLLAAREADTDAAQFWLLTDAATSIAMALLAAALGVYLLLRQRIASQTRELALEIQHMQRLGIMNQTSSVLAHEILHPLTAAQNYAGVLGSIVESGGRDGAMSPLPIVRKLEGQIQRAADIVKRLRAFVGRSDGLHVPERMESLIGDAAELFEIIDRSVDLETRIAPDLPDVLIDRVQIRQVMVNLMRNAVDAMRGCDTRILRVSAASISQAQVEIRFEDSGKGLSPGMAGRLFESFVGDNSEGMGLGLSICRSIVAAHGGTIRAEPSATGGAVFCFTLPVVPAGWVRNRVQTGSARTAAVVNAGGDHSPFPDEIAMPIRTSS